MRQSAQSGATQNAAGWVFTAPWVAGLLLLYVYPFVASLVWSFSRYDLLTDPELVGLDNYRDLLGELRSGGDFRTALWNTLYFALVAVPATVIVGVGLAIVLVHQRRFQTLGRTLVYLPSVLPTVAAAILWLWILDPGSGPVAALLARLGVAGPGWFRSPSEGFTPPGFFDFGSKDALVMLTVWASGNWIIIYLAGLLNIPQTLYEAAALDGAGALRRLWHVTLPKLSPIIFFNVVMGLIESIQLFTPAYIVSEGTGEPAGATLLLSIYLFQTAFADLQMGVASAVSWILFLVLAVVTWSLFRFSRRWVHVGP